MGKPQGEDHVPKPKLPKRTNEHHVPKSESPKRTNHKGNITFSNPSCREKHISNKERGGLLERTSSLEELSPTCFKIEIVYAHYNAINLRLLLIKCTQN